MTAAERDWKIRGHVYQVMLKGGAAPTAASIAARFGMETAAARGSLRRLHEAHALVLDEARETIVMAHPLAAAPTDYRACVDGVTLYANCAWDSLGIAAMLGRDADIFARHPLDGDEHNYAVIDGQLRCAGDELVHFAHPFRQWYRDIADT